LRVLVPRRVKPAIRAELIVGSSLRVPSSNSAAVGPNEFDPSDPGGGRLCAKRPNPRRASLEAITYASKSRRAGQLTQYSGRIAADFGGTETMTKPAHTMPPPDATERRRAPPVLTYSVEQMPSFNAAFYNGRALSCRKLPSSRCRPGMPGHSRCRRDTSSV
jgi:hypothetical protein